MYSDAVFYLIVSGAVAIFVIGVGLQIYYWVDQDRVQRTFEDRMERSLDAMDQSWFSDETWQAGEAGADADLAAGRTRTYPDEDAFRESLDALPAADRR